MFLIAVTNLLDNHNSCISLLQNFRYDRWTCLAIWLSKEEHEQSAYKHACAVMSRRGRSRAGSQLGDMMRKETIQRQIFIQPRCDTYIPRSMRRCVCESAARTWRPANASGIRVFAVVQIFVSVRSLYSCDNIFLSSLAARSVLYNTAVSGQRGCCRSSHQSQVPSS